MDASPQAKAPQAPPAPAAVQRAPSQAPVREQSPPLAAHVGYPGLYPILEKERPLIGSVPEPQAAEGAAHIHSDLCTKAFGATCLLQHVVHPVCPFFAKKGFCKEALFYHEAMKQTRKGHPPPTPAQPCPYGTNHCIPMIAQGVKCLMAPMVNGVAVSDGSASMPLSNTKRDGPKLLSEIKREKAARAKAEQASEIRKTEEQANTRLTALANVIRGNLAASMQTQHAEVRAAKRTRHDVKLDQRGDLVLPPEVLRLAEAAVAIKRTTRDSIMQAVMRQKDQDAKKEESRRAEASPSPNPGAE